MIKTNFLAVIVLLLFTACSLKKKEPMLHEKGVVIEKQYSPGFEASGVGYDTKGKLSVHTLSADEKYMVVFRCQHGIVFSINRSSLYAKLNKDDIVIIDYYEMVDNDDQVKDFDFVDANKLK